MRFTAILSEETESTKFARHEIILRKTTKKILKNINSGRRKIHGVITSLHSLREAAASSSGEMGEGQRERLRFAGSNGLRGFILFRWRMRDTCSEGDISALGSFNAVNSFKC